MKSILNQLDESNIFAGLRYALGLTEQKPANPLFGIAPERIRAFWQKWLDMHPSVRVSVRPKTPTGATASSNRPAAAPPAEPRDFLTMGRALATRMGICLGEALARVAREHPDEYKAFLQRSREVGAAQAERRILKSENEGLQKQAKSK